MIFAESNGVDAKSVDYARLVSLLIEAVKEQQKQIKDLEEKMASLEQKYGFVSK